jgi:hypothetical protein
VIPQLITRKQHHMVHHVIPQLITRKQHHMVHHVILQLITRKQHHMVSPCDSTINHKQTTSHGAHDISQCIMESYIQLTPLNNYLSNCVIKLPMKLLTPNLPLNNCVIKLHTKLQTLLYMRAQLGMMLHWFSIFGVISYPLMRAFQHNLD